MSNNFLRNTSALAHHIEGLEWELVHQTQKKHSHLLEQTLSGSEHNQQFLLDKTGYISQLLHGLLHAYENIDLSAINIYRYPALSLFLLHFRVVLYRKLYQLTKSDSYNIDEKFISSLSRSHQLFEKFSGRMIAEGPRLDRQQDQTKASEFIENIKKKQKALRSIG